MRNKTHTHTHNPGNNVIIKLQAITHLIHAECSDIVCVNTEGSSSGHRVLSFWAKDLRGEKSRCSWHQRLELLEKAWLHYSRIALLNEWKKKTACSAAVHHMHLWQEVGTCRLGEIPLGLGQTAGTYKPLWLDQMGRRQHLNPALLLCVWECVCGGEQGWMGGSHPWRQNLTTSCLNTMIQRYQSFYNPIPVETVSTFVYIYCFSAFNQKLRHKSTADECLRVHLKRCKKWKSENQRGLAGSPWVRQGTLGTSE